jgi:calcineurin-like phosphoesterase family protein
MIWLTSDEHYYHHNMLMHRTTYGGGRGDYTSRRFRTTDEMHRHIKSKHNELVKKDDIVYHLGDFAYGPGAKSWQQVGAVLSLLNGEHHLILGNHDHIKPFDYLEAGFTSVHTSLMLDDYLLVHDPAIAGVLLNHKVIHGHTHSLGLRLRENTYCVCVDINNYYPVSFDTIKEAFGDGGV